MKEREAEFTRDIQQLAQQQTFSTSAFEALVDKIRTHVAEVRPGTSVWVALLFRLCKMRVVLYVHS